MTEVILVGTFHYPDRFDVFSHDMQSQIDEFTNKLALLHPNKIAVEFPRRMQKDLDELYASSAKYSFGDDVVYGNVERYGSVVPFKSVNEIAQIGFRLGEKLKHDRIYGIDEDVELSDELFAKIASSLDVNSFFEKMRKMTEQAQDLEGLYSIHNGDDYITLDHSIYLAMNKINPGEYEGSRLVLQWYERNLKIFSNLQNLCEKGDRVLVLIGSAHLKVLKELIAASAEMNLCEGV